MKTLKQLCNKYKEGDFPDKDSVHSYIDVYEEVLAPYRNTAKNILEIGLMSGQSLRMWEEYFTHNVYGIDCSETPVDGLADLRPIIAEGTHNIFIGDAANSLDVEKFFKGIYFDVVIEDASHEIRQQQQMYSALKPYLAPNSIYIIEDVQDIDATRSIFENIDKDKEVKIIDRRHIKNRYDDVIVIIK